MFNKLLKPYLPRSLFGRAFLILIVPIVLIQVVVGVVFVERLFHDVTRQMTSAVSLDLNFVIAEQKQGNEYLLPAKSLNIDINSTKDVDFLDNDRLRSIYDFSGPYVIQTLREMVPEIRQIDLGREKNRVFVLADIMGENVVFSFSRQRVSATNPHQLLVYMILTAILFSTVAALFLRNQISPIRRLAQAAEAFGKGQLLPLSPRGASEVRSAAYAFLSMRARIERQIEQRTMMLSGVSHDLRTPLTRLRLSVSMLEEDEETHLMLRDLSEMEAILDEFLAFSRGDSEEQSEPVSPREQAEELVQNAERSGRDVSLKFVGAEDGDSPVNMRKVAVQRAISNMMSNALKYGEKVTVSVYSGAGFVEFIVEDDGPGIALKDRENAVKPFARLDVARNQDKGAGVGLGLAIAADVARSHGGSLTLAESETLGGLKAAFRLPR